MPRAINDKIDALFVEGLDDGAVVNALIEKLASIDLAMRSHQIVKLKQDGGGASWAIREFERRIAEAQPNARVGVIVDRDDPTNDKWPAVSEILRRLGVDPRGGPNAAGVIVDGRFGLWMWPDNVSHGDLEDFVAGNHAAITDPHLRWRGVPPREDGTRCGIRAPSLPQGRTEGP